MSAQVRADRVMLRPPRPAHTAVAPVPRDSRVALALFLLFAGFYLLTTSGHFYAVDEEVLYLATESLVERRTLALPEGAWGVGNAPEPGAPVYSRYAPGQSVAAAPLYLLGRMVAPHFPPDARGYVPRFFVTLLGPLVTAATIGLLYRFGRALGGSTRAALALAAIYGLATTAWPHGRTFFAEPLTALGLLLAFYALHQGAAGMRSAECGVRNRVTGAAPAEYVSPRHSVFRTPHSAFAWFVLSGVAAVAAVATKPQAAIALPVLGLYLAGRVARTGQMLGAALAWGLGLALAALPYAAFNAATYGGPLRTGYGAGALDPFDAPFLTGLYGLTVSSGKGLLWYSPPVLLAVAGWWPFYRRHRAEALACLGVVAVHVLFYSPLRFWHGDGSWGPRYLMLALPFAMLPLLGLRERLPGRPALRALVLAVVGWGLAVQLLGVLVNFDWYLLRSDERTRHFSPPASPILAHAGTLAARLREWRARAWPLPDTALLTAGFAPGEGERAELLFPRWTTGAGEITLRAAAREPLLVKLTYFDHRPPGQRQPPQLLVNGAALDASTIERRDLTGTGEGWVYQFTVPAEALDDLRTTVTLRSTTWNPRAAGQGDRDEDLGLYVHNVEVWRAGQPWPVREALAFEPMPRTPRWRFWWFNDDSTRHHLVDHWAWYAAVAGFGRDRTVAWIASCTAVASAPLLAGLVLLRRGLPPGTLGNARIAARPQRRQKPRAGARAATRAALSPGEQARPVRRRGG